MTTCRENLNNLINCERSTATTTSKLEVDPLMKKKVEMVE